MLTYLKKTLAVYLVFWVLLLGMLPNDSWAWVIGADSVSGQSSDSVGLQRQLESKLVSQRLSELGLTASEAQSRVAQLSDEEVHLLAANLDGLQVGGDAAVIFIAAFAGAVLLAILFITALMPALRGRDHAESHAGPVVVEPSHHH